MKKVVIAGLILFLIGITGLAFTFNNGFASGIIKVNERKHVDGSKVNAININSASTDVNILPGNGNRITIALQGRASKKLKDLYTLSVKQTGSSLTIELERDFKLTVGIPIDNIDLNVTLPKKLYSKIIVESTSGDSNIQELNADSLGAETHSGDIQLKDIRSKKKVSLTSASGDLKISNVKTNQLYADVNSGDISQQDIESKSLNLQSSSGDISLANIAGKVDAKASSGDMILTDINGEIHTQTGSGDIKIENKEIAGKITSETSSGDVTVSFSKKPSSIAVDYKSRSGSGKVKLDGLLYEEKSEDEMIGIKGKGDYLVKARTASGDFLLK